MFKRLICLTCLGLALSLVSNASAQLLVHYKLDETAGSIASDSSGKGNDGTLSGDPQWANGWMDGALEFNGEDFITLPADRMGLRSDTGTVAFWINMGVPASINTIWWGGDNTIGGGFGPENEMHIHVESPVANIWIGGELGFYLQGDPNNIHLHSDPNKGDPPGNPPVSPALMSDGQWHHVTATWGNPDGNAKLYLEGRLLHELPYDWTNISYPLTNIFLGKMANDSRTYVGLLDDVQIYGGALTADEIQIVMAGGEILNLKAALPEPAHQATEVPRDTVLRWMPGDRAETHNVYFGTNFDDVNEASIINWQKALVSHNQEGMTYDPPDLLEFNTTYYWRVDEVNAPPDAGVIRGNVWSFTTANFVVVDDFESYTDNDPAGEAIWQSWIDGFGVAENGAQAGYVMPPYAEQAIIHGGKQSMPLLYDNDMKYSEAKRALDSPRDWTRDDVKDLSLWFRGNPAYVGSFAEGPAGTYTMTGSGVDIWGGSDEFHFAFKEVNAAPMIRAQVVSLENTNAFAKAGVMIRDTLDPDSANVAVFVTPENGIRFQYRSTTGGITERYFAEGMTAPYWVRLERTSGGLVRAYYAEDGKTWTRFDLVQITMDMPLYIGLAVTSHDADLTCEAVFSNITFPYMTVDPQWTDQDIGIMSNRAEPMYVAVSNSTGAPAVVYHEDPNAAQTDTWTEWIIPLQAFADQGMDLTDIDSIAIGLGTKGDTTKPGGSGTMYFDDIRLYRPIPPVDVTIENFSFELPGTEKQAGFDNVSGWNTDGPCADSGVETGYTPTDGDWTAYLMSGDPSVWQLTNYTITEGDVLELKVDARITWAATTMRMTLYYDDGGTRVAVATSEVALTDAMQEHVLSFSAYDDPAATGHQIGIEFSNASTGDTWIGLDNVRLEVTTD